MNRSVRRHLNKYKKYFLKFFWVSVYTLGGPEMVKKLEFLHFCRILDVFGHFNQYNHEKSTKIKVILEICVIKFRKSTNTSGGNSFSDHHRGSNAKILSKKGRKFSISQFSSIEICRTPIKNIPNKLVYYTHEMD